MPLFQRNLVSGVYSNPPHIIEDVLGEHYNAWGYALAYEFDENGQPVPPEGNTAHYRIDPGASTEPNYIIKTDPGATFTLQVKSGEGAVVHAQPGGAPQISRLCEDYPVVLRRGTAYFIVNTGDVDLMVQDTAVPAFQNGDELKLTSSAILPDEVQRPVDNDEVLTMVESEGTTRTVPLHAGFFEKLADVVTGKFQVH